MEGRNTVLPDAISCRIPLVSDVPTIIYGADVTHLENGENSSPSTAIIRLPKSIYFDFYLFAIIIENLTTDVAQSIGGSFSGLT